MLKHSIRSTTGSFDSVKGHVHYSNVLIQAIPDEVLKGHVYLYILVCPDVNIVLDYLIAFFKISFALTALRGNSVLFPLHKMDVGMYTHFTQMLCCIFNFTLALTKAKKFPQSMKALLFFFRKTFLIELHTAQAVILMAF